MISVVVAILGLALLWFSVRALFEPGIALALMWSMYAAEQLFQLGGSIFLQVGSLLNFAFAGLMLLSVFNAISRGKLRGFKTPPEMWLSWGLYGIAVLSFLWSISQPDTEKWLIKTAPYIFAFAICAPFCATDQKQIRLAINTTIFFGCIVLVGHALGSYGRRSLVLLRSSSGDLETNPLAVASHAGYVSVCALFSIYGRKFSPLIAFKGAVFVLGAYVIIKSGSRGQLVALAVVSFLWLPIVARASFKRSTVLSILLAAVIVGGFIYTVYQLQGTGRWKADLVASAQEGRFYIMRGMLEYWFNSGVGTWIFGLGSSSSFKLYDIYPHNVPVEVLTEEGLLGFAIYLSFCCCVIFRGGKVMFLKSLKQESRVNLGILLALFCFEGLLSLKQGSFLGNSPWVGFGVTVGFVSNRFLREARREENENRMLQQNMMFHHAQQNPR